MYIHVQKYTWFGQYIIQFEQQCGYKKDILTILNKIYLIVFNVHYSGVTHNRLKWNFLILCNTESYREINLILSTSGSSGKPINALCFEYPPKWILITCSTCNYIQMKYCKISYTVIEYFYNIPIILLELLLWK